MRRSTLLLLATLFVGVAVQFAPSSAATCTPTPGKPTAAGGQKDGCGSVHCGTRGKLQTVSTISAYANQTPNGAEVEACGDDGPGNGQGRLIVQVDSTKGARVILDTDDGQPFPPSYIIVQASQDHPGVWCNQDQGTNADPPARSDGYARGWGSPGTDGGLSPDATHCLPTQ